MLTLRFLDRALAPVAAGVAACAHALQALPVASDGSEPVSTHDQLARVSCGDASVTFLGDAQAGPDDPSGGLREIVVEVGSESISWGHYDGSRMFDWPEVTFAPDCRRVAGHRHAEEVTRGLHASSGR